MCEGCHNSTHAEWASGRSEDNADVIALQGTAGPLRDCRVCHGVDPAGLGPHDLGAPTGVSDEILAGARGITVMPNPTRGGCSVELAARGDGGGTLVVFDAQGRAVRLLQPRSSGSQRLRAEWDGLDHDGRSVGAGVYFVRWLQGGDRAGARITVVK
jgi:hypothetical protein